MCLDIDPDSVIHKHLVKKIDDLDDSWVCGQTDTYWYNHPIIKTEPQYSAKIEKENHNLTMLPSFHISLGAPKKDIADINVKEINNMLTRKTDHVPIIGEITLAPICISETKNKKSAWICLDFARIIHPDISFNHWTSLNLGNFGRAGLGFDLYKSDGTPFHRFHISLANLTGNPHDSIARPEDCIIDTITN